MVRSKRDEFLVSVRRNLAKRVNYVCSNPGCMKITSGPHSNPRKANLTGKASHITAAASNGPRYDPKLTSEQRKSPKNGIWLCATCADLIDNDAEGYPVELVIEWKAKTELLIKTAQANNLSLGLQDDDSYSKDAIAEQLRSITDALSESIEDKLEAMREFLREGQSQKVVAWEQSIESDPIKWNALTPRAKGKIFRLKAILELDINNDLEAAAKFVSQAQRFAPDENYTPILALITKGQHGFNMAIGLLEDAEDIDSINLKAAFAIETADLDRCINILDQLNDTTANAESFRLLAIAHLAKRQIEKALLYIQKSMELKPNWYSIRFWSGVIDYFSTHHQFTIHDHLIPHPMPVDPAEIKSDKQSLARLRRASEVFKTLLKEPKNRIAKRDHLQAWYLGCLAIDPDRQAEAEADCVELLKDDPTNHHALDWALARNYTFDIDASESALSELMDQASATVTDVRSLVIILEVTDRIEASLQILNEQRELFLKTENLMMWTSICCRLYLMSDNPSGMSLIQI